MPTLATENTCTGCAACENICPHKAIVMTENHEGFLQPVVDYDKCVECKLCEKACPIVNGKNLKNKEVTEAFAFWDNQYRTESSSGGAFTGIARYIFGQGGIVFGAVLEDGFKICHSKADNMQELVKMRGSKYVQSDIRHTFREVRDVLKDGRQVLFSGTPCQIAGLKGFLIKPYDNLLTIDIVCHGVPNYKIFESYLTKLKKNGDKFKDIESFIFRDTDGWSKIPMIKTPQKSFYLTGTDNLYMGAFDKAMLFRKSCYDCNFNGLSRTGDITIADFWGIGKFGTPFKEDISKGVSLILPNSEKGKEVISRLRDCFMEKRSLSEALPLNHNIIASSPHPDSRDEVIQAFLNQDSSLKAIDKRFHITDRSIKGTIKMLLIKTGLLKSTKKMISKLK